ncbi:MAG: META domain-containing protein [Alistipes sp.]|nr:META domain-containing protein [Alistipes sp.]
MKRCFAAAALLVAAVACDRRADLPLEGTGWKLSSMAGIPAETIAAEEDAFTLWFDAAETLVAGRTNCNRFFGPYRLAGRDLEFGDLGMTRMACPGMEYEDLFVGMLDEVDGYRIEGDRLVLTDDGEVLAVFSAVELPADE